MGGARFVGASERVERETVIEADGAADGSAGR